MANSYGIIGLEHAHAVAPRGTMDLVPQFDADTMNIVEAQAVLIEQGVIEVKRGAASIEPLAGPFRKLMGQENVSGPAGNGFLPGKTKRFSGLLDQMGPQVSPLLTGPHHPGPLRRHDWPNCENYQVHAGPGGLVVGSEAGLLPLHTEDDTFAHWLMKSIGCPNEARPNLILTGMTAVNDFATGMGGTLLVPGSH